MITYQIIAMKKMTTNFSSKRNPKTSWQANKLNMMRRAKQAKT